MTNVGNFTIVSENARYRHKIRRFGQNRLYQQNSSIYGCVIKFRDFKLKWTRDNDSMVILKRRFGVISTGQAWEFGVLNVLCTVWHSCLD